MALSSIFLPAGKSEGFSTRGGKDGKKQQLEGVMGRWLLVDADVSSASWRTKFS